MNKEKDLFTEITKDEYSEKNSKIFNIDKYFYLLGSKYRANRVFTSSYSYLEIDIIEKRSNGTDGDNKIKLTVTLCDDDWFMVKMDKYVWMVSWRRRTQTTYWMCDQIDGLISLIDTVKDDIWGFLTPSY